jgi:hypothetical protein
VSRRRSRKKKEIDPERISELASGVLLQAIEDGEREFPMLQFWLDVWGAPGATLATWYARFDHAVKYLASKRRRKKSSA